MCLHQPEQCMDAMVGLLAESGVKLLQQGEILHCIERKAKIQPPFQLIGQRKQANAERFGMCIEINRNVLYVQFFLCSGGCTAQGIGSRQLGKQAQMRFDSGTAVCKTVSDIICRAGIVLLEESPEAVGTQERIVRTDTDKAVKVECCGSPDKAVEYIVLVSPVATDTCFAGNLCQYIILRTVGSGKHNGLTGAGLLDISD